MGKEIEYKLRAKDARELGEVYERLCSRYAAGQEQVIAMHTRYFDTPDRALKEKKWTLRIRRENDREVLTCKTPGKGHSRGEWSLDRTRTEPSPQPEELRALAASGAPEALCALREFQPVCGARFTRRCTMLEVSGTRIELAADLGQLYGPNSQEDLCELELELYGGRFEVLSAVAALTGLPEEPRSKFARAQLLR